MHDPYPTPTVSPERPRHMTRFVRTAAVAVVLAASACGPRPLQLPEPRPLIVSSGARLTADEETLRPIYEWVNAEIENIDMDPNFLVRTTPTSSDVYPWETLEVVVVDGGVDTVSVQYRRSAPDVQQVYQLYAHMHLMAETGEIETWVPEAVGLDGWELESAILARVTDAWLLGRASFDFAPYDRLDEFMYAADAGMLDAFVLTIRGWEFPEARDAWLARDPDGETRVRDWYRETFGMELDRGN